MKVVMAYIKSHKLDNVTAVLKSVDGLTGITVFECRGFGLKWRTSDALHDDEMLDSRKGVKIEIVCLDRLADQVVAAIESAAHTGLKGDGKIYVAEISHAVRISTGETGDCAV